MNTNRRTFLMLALTGVVVCASANVAAADEAATDVVRVTLDVQGMH